MATTATQDKLRKPLAFEVTEPHGCAVICAQSTWNGHISRDHPEMTARQDDVKTALSDPDDIYESTSRAEARVYERVTEDQVQIRVVATFDEVTLIESGQTIAKVNSAFPVQPEEYDTPRIGRKTYTRPVAEQEKGGSK